MYSDGACSGNPGPSAVAFIILDSEGRILREHSEFIGIGTNNQAEYKALILALKSASNLGDEIVCYSDSNLMVKQMSGEWRVKHPNMLSLWRHAVGLKEKFSKTSFVYVPRTNKYIERIDRLANQELNRRSDQRSFDSVVNKMGKGEEHQLNTNANENTLLRETNKGGYKLEVIAKFEEPYPVSYTIRISTPDGVKADYISTLEGFKNIGELLMALHYFAHTKLYPKDVNRLREVLTAENIKNFAEVLKSAKFSL
jgi:ribonuclease HI